MPSSLLTLLHLSPLLLLRPLAFPDEVTFAFTPYGVSLEVYLHEGNEVVLRARGDKETFPEGVASVEDDVEGDADVSREDVLQRHKNSISRRHQHIPTTLTLQSKSCPFTAAHPCAANINPARMTVPTGNTGKSG